MSGSLRDGYLLPQLLYPFGKDWNLLQDFFLTFKRCLQAVNRRAALADGGFGSLTPSSSSVWNWTELNISKGSGMSFLPCSSIAATLLKVFFFFAIGIAWNAILLNVSNFQWWFLLGNHNHQANPHVHQQYNVWATTFRSGMSQPLSSQMARRERKPTNI